MICQHNGQLYSERAEKYEIDEASDSGESNKSPSGALKTLQIYVMILALCHIMFMYHMEINVVHLRNPGVHHRILLPTGN